MNVQKSSPQPSSKRINGFSLAELMVVISVIAFLLAMAAPNIFSLMRSSELATQGDMFRNWLTLAQQKALSTNSDVEVRFYKFQDLDNAQPTKEFRAMQFFQYSPEGELVPISEIYTLNDPLIFATSSSKGCNLSSILERGTETTVSDLNRFGGGIQEVSYRSFRFHPDGSTNLNMANSNSDNVQSKNWYITMIEERPESAQTTEIYNYFSVQIDPFNGSIRTFRP
tara:strand:- start:4776 stop:5453 length:678 start_codon:yes stop_codon:yes gene_type:complete